MSFPYLDFRCTSLGNPAQQPQARPGPVGPSGRFEQVVDPAPVADKKLIVLGDDGNRGTRIALTRTTTDQLAVNAR